jgi:hypothetical protein
MKSVSPFKVLLVIFRNNCFHVVFTTRVDVGRAMGEIRMEKWSLTGPVLRISLIPTVDLALGWPGMSSCNGPCNWLD